MKQLSFLPDDDNGSTKYTTASGSPIYVPKDRSPHVLNLVNTGKATTLKRNIEKANIDEEEKRFLIVAAQRHNVFNYELIADYYAHASPEMQQLMEDSALVIIDVNKAIEHGYIRLCDAMRKLHMEESVDA